MSLTFRNLFFSALIWMFGVVSASAQVPTNPILFVSAVPTPLDSATQTATIGSHLGGPANAPRGGDLYIRYPDGTLKNLTQLGGFGQTGIQDLFSIAVREPFVDWTGRKAVFSMVVGAPLFAGDTTTRFWQLYEVTGLGQNDNSNIRRVNNQPEFSNNISPTYGTDGRIIFVSDRPLDGLGHIYPNRDESRGVESNTGLWSLEENSGNLILLDHVPSGASSPSVDSYGRVIYSRWDQLQRDKLADSDAISGGRHGSFNYSDETEFAVFKFGERTELFPEPRPPRTDLLAGTDLNGYEHSYFAPWSIEEDGANSSTLNHLGRQDLNGSFKASIKSDANVKDFQAATSGRTNQNAVSNLLQLREDPRNSGTYFAIDAPFSGTHGGGQIVKFNALPTQDPNETVVSHLTNRLTATATPEGQTPSLDHSGFYRNVLPTSDGLLIASASTQTFEDKNGRTRSNPLSRFRWRLKYVVNNAGSWSSSGLLTTGLNKQVMYYDPDSLVTFDGALWELDAVEVVARPLPKKRVSAMSSIELAVFREEKVDTAHFQSYLRRNNQALIVCRDVTYRDKFEKQQPFYLRVAGTNHQSNNATGTIYDVKELQIFQADYLRGYGLVQGSEPPLAGRRVLAQPMHSVVNKSNAGKSAGSVVIEKDGSLAAFVPAGRAITWQINDATQKPVVRERYWMTMKAGSVRVCATCHDNNLEATTPQSAIASNKPEALRTLLRVWRAANVPAKPTLISPANNTRNVLLPHLLTWRGVDLATSYRIAISSMVGGNLTQIFSDTVFVPLTSFSVDSKIVGGSFTSLHWSVTPIGEFGEGLASETWQFSAPEKVAPIVLVSPTNGEKVPSNDILLKWKADPNAVIYRIQVSSRQTFSIIEYDDSTASNFYDLKDQVAGLTYYWRVSGKNALGQGLWSGIWNFTTKASVPLKTMALLSPPDSSLLETQPVTLSWRDIAVGAIYTGQIATNPNFSPASSFTVTTTSYTSTFQEYNTRYYWRIFARKDADSTAWSEAWSFVPKEPPTKTEEVVGSTGIWTFPNPTSRVVSLKLSDELSRKQIDAPQLKVFSSHGEEVSKSVTITTLDFGSAIGFSLDFHFLPSGSYRVVGEIGGNSFRETISVVK